MFKRLLPYLLLILFAACAPLSRSADPDSLSSDVQRVAEAVTARLAGQPAASDPAVDVDAIVQAVVAALEPQLAQPAPTVKKGSAMITASSELEATLIALYQRANPATVYILTPLSSGSGFVYSADGHIVTNHHVIANSNSFEIVFADGTRRAGRLVGQDVDSDLAVLQVQDLPAGVTPLPLAQPGDSRVGQFVIAIGNPFGEQGSMSLGIISGLDRSLRSQRAGVSGGGYSLPAVIQTDAPINPGNSGGPLLNLAGEVVGVNSAIASTNGVGSGVGFAIPVAAVRRIVPSLIASGRYDYPYLGVSFAEELTLSGQQALGLKEAQGAYVLGVNSGGPAERAGLVAADASGRGGDLIVAIDGQPIRNFSDLNNFLVFQADVGQTITLSLLRGARQVDLTLTLGARP